MSEKMNKMLAIIEVAVKNARQIGEIVDTKLQD